MIHGLVIAGRGGNLLCERYYSDWNGAMSGPPAGTSPVGLSSLTQRTGHDDATTDNKAISQLRSEVHNFIATLPLAREGEEMIATLRSWFLVYTLSGELSVYALGSDEDDELALCELVRTLVGVLKSLARKAPLTEGALLDVVGPVHLALDEVIAGGIVDRTDLDTVKKLIKMKFEQ